MRAETSGTMPPGLCPLVWVFLGLLSAAWAVPQAHLPYEPPEPSPVDGAPNLLLHGKVTASSHWSDRVPEFAVDGRRENPGEHWAAENIPVWLTVDMGQARELNLIRLWTFWDHHRYYQYVIEGSVDGETWTVLADCRNNTRPADEAGVTLQFPTQRVRFVRTTFTHNSASNVAGGHIVEIEGYALPPAELDKLAQREADWARVPPGLNAAWGSTDVRYSRSQVPRVDGGGTWSGTAWREERVSAEAVVWSAQGHRQVRVKPTALQTETGEELPARCVPTRFVRYVLADGQLVPDVLDTARRLNMEARTTRPVWVSVDVPQDARPGIYRGQVVVLTEGASAVLDLELEVLPWLLPPPAEWSFWLDLWQNPFALARYHRVEPWSADHLRLLEPHLRLLAEAGQKCATTTIVHQPWGTQTYDPYDSMVEWVRHADGTWSFDYSAFDQYVELCQRCGITGAINCYSMVPWTHAVRYLDEATGDYRTAFAGPGTPEYEELWTPFLASFVQHLRERGWLERTAIAMDERPPELMWPFLKFLDRVAPDLKVTLAGGNTPELKDRIDDWCVFITPPLDSSIARERAERGRPTTFYVCCGPGRPNTFTFSPPAEATWLGWYAAARDYTGFLRWAFDSWVADPLWDTSYVTWPAGDCFLVYPGARSSIRFERLREGIQDFEKVRLLRRALMAQSDHASHESIRRLEEALERFDYERVQSEPAQIPVREAQRVLAELARKHTPTP